MGYPKVWINAKVTDKIGFAVTTGPYQAMPLPTSWQVNLLDKACFLPRTCFQLVLAGSV